MQTATRRRSLLAALVLAGACLFPASALGGEADDHFAKGNAAFEAEKYEAALAEYQAAWKLTKVYDLAAIMGQAEMRLGKYKEAAEHFAYALRTFPLSGDEELRKNTEASLATVKKEIATVRIKVFVKDATVTIGGAALEPAQVGSDVFLAPGKVTIEAAAPGYRAEHKTYEAKAGADEDITLTMQPESGGRSATPAFVLGGVGVVGIVIGAALVGAAEGKKGEALKLHDEIGSDAGCKADATKCKALRDASSQADALGNGGVAAFVFGGLAGAAAGAYLLIPSRKPASKAGVSLTPVLSAGAGGVIVNGFF